MIWYRIYAPAKEQGLFTPAEIYVKYGKLWKQALKKYRTEKIDSGDWYKQFTNDAKVWKQV